MNIRELTDQIIKEVQNGNCPSREAIPENIRGRLAINLWNDPTFTLGIEYGVILAALVIQESIKKNNYE